MQTIAYQIVDVEILEHSFKQINYKINPDTKFGFQIQGDLRIDHEKKQINIISLVEITPEDQKEEIAGSILTLCSFFVTNYDELITEDEPLKVTPNNVATFQMIALSTTRGLIHGVFRGTPLHYAILPMINRDSLLSSTEGYTIEQK